MATAGVDPTRTIVVDAARSSYSAALAEAWRERELAGFLVWRDVKVRYKQSAVGFIWAVVQPVGLALVLALFLGRYARLPSGGEDYWLLALSGMVPFSYFSQALLGSSNSLVDNGPLVSKVYFPRLLLPVAGAGSNLSDGLVASVVLVAAALFAGEANLMAPLALLVMPLVGVVSLSFAIWLAALNVRYRDVKVITPFLLQLWLFATPVAYPVSVVPEPLRWFYAVNPMVGVVELERRLVLGEGEVALLLPGLALSALLVAVGIRYFLRSAQWFADVI